MRKIKLLWGIILIAAMQTDRAAADDKFISLTETPNFHGLEVSADGSKLYMSNGQVFDGTGTMINRFKVSGREIVPLPNGWFIVGVPGNPSSGHIGLVRPDGTEAKRLVGKGGSNGDWTSPDLEMKVLRADMTGWTSPCGMAVDPVNKLIFAIDTTMAQRDDRNLPDPDWSRIAVFDFDGNYVRDIYRYNALAINAKETDDRRTWYRDIEVDPQRKRVYVTTNRFRELLAFDYAGTLINKVKPAVGNGAIAVLPDGRVAVGNGWRVVVYDTDLKELTQIDTPQTEYKNWAEGIRDLESDASGRLYAITGDRTIAFIRWSADFQTAEAVGGPDYLRIIVGFPDTALTAGQPVLIKVQVRARPELERTDRWQVLMRPTDGSDLAWQPMPSEYKDGTVVFEVPEDYRGFYDIMVLFGDDPPAVNNIRNEPCVQRSFAIAPAGAAQSVAIFSPEARSAFVQGEAIPLQVLRKLQKPEEAAEAPLTLTLKRKGDTLATASLAITDRKAVELPAGVTEKLAPGEYTLVPQTEACASYPFRFYIAPAAQDSPVQRIIYHEMGNAGSADQHTLPTTADKMAFAKDWAQGMARLHVNRETDRIIATSTWRHDAVPANVSAPAYAPAEYYGIPNNRNWSVEYYLDQATRYGISVDSQILGHCSGVRFRDFWLDQLNPRLQRDAQWRGRYPSFYGFNYNDEMFFGQWVFDWTQSDNDWLKNIADTKFADSKNPMADTYRYALRRMYDSFNSAVQLANPNINRTATPMWQFPAVDGSYAPEVYKGMTETYSHYVSEGYHIPWYVPHTAENLRRPGLPLRGVFDPGVGGGPGYVKDAMLMLSRGVQGIGTQYDGPWDRGRHTDGVIVANLIAKIYGPVFGAFDPANEAAVLYSYSQDVTERRNGIGTPHFERVWALYGAGLMTGVPMSIVYEEDLANGWLLADGKPRVPMFFLAGQKEPLPQPVQKAIAAYVQAGGRLFTDADSAEYPGAVRLDLDLHETGPIHGQTYAADSAWPMFQPGFEKLAKEFGAAVKQYRRYPMDTDDVWVAKSQFDGGDIHYMMLASEVSPYPWDAGTMWSMMNACYNGQWQPKNVSLSFPAAKGVVYDVFNHTLLKPQTNGNTSSLQVDLSTFPASLLAVAPAELAAPALQAIVREDSFTCGVSVMTVDNREISARIPLRIRLFSGDQVALEVYRGTDVRGLFNETFPLPINAKTWTLEVTEMLGGKGATAAITSDQKIENLVAERPDVEILRADRVSALLDMAKEKGMTLVMANENILSKQQIDSLTAALREKGVALKVGPTAPEQPTPGIYLAAGFVKGNGRDLGDMLRQVKDQNLLTYPLTENAVPGEGRGIVSAVMAARNYREDCIALIGGDADGLSKSVSRFNDWLARPGKKTGTVTAATANVKGQPADVPAIPAVNEMTGVHLANIKLAADGKHLAIAANGFLRNLALIRDEGDRATVLRAERVGQARDLGSLYVSADGSKFGASARTVADFGEGFHLYDAVIDDRETGPLPVGDVFAGFGDMPPQQHHFAANDAGDLVITPGTAGYICWKRNGGQWKEAWSNEYWKNFNQLDWPIASDNERIPQFNAYIPAGADFALIVFCEFSQNGWVTPENYCTAYVAAVNLADGTERWRFDVPIPKTQLWPTLHSSSDGKNLLLQVQKGGWGRETFAFFALEDGKMLAKWDSPSAPAGVAIANGTGRIAETFQPAKRGASGGRLLEVRSAKGELIYNVQFANQPLSLAFAKDGKTLFVSDDAGKLFCFDENGGIAWTTEIGCVTELAANGNRLYAAGWDGRVRCIGLDGSSIWTLDCNASLGAGHGMDIITASAQYGDVIRAKRSANTSNSVPEGENLLATGKATLTLGGTGGWMSNGALLVKADQLTNGKLDDVDSPWLHLDEVFWDAGAGRQVYATIEFKEPTDVKAVTVYENPKFKESWPTQGLIQVWNEELQRWDTVTMGMWLTGPVNSYNVDLKAVKKLRYAPWSNYYRNFYTSEIEVR